jgi:inosine-uridine nucleoside N-ribohydrolase
LTNVGALVGARPRLAARIDELVCVPGRRPGQSFRASPDQPTPFRDLNFELDPDAMATILATGVPVTLAPWEASRELWFGGAQLARMARGSDACRWLAGPARDWLDF